MIGRMTVCFLPSLAALVYAGTPDATHQTLKVDPVELIRGKEVPGRENISAEFGHYRYLFDSEENKAAFLADPSRFEIQLGGACARMGPLSGKGSPELFAVHEGRIYIFASEACKKTFLAGPEKLLDRPDPKPESNPKDLQRGRELIELALRGLGGAEKVDALSSYRAEHIETVKSGDKQYKHRRAWTIRFPGDYRVDDDWDEGKWAAVATRDDAFFTSSEIRTMHAQQRAALEKDFHRDPLVILRNRNRPDFVAVAAGTGQVQSTPVEFVTVAFQQATSKLGVDPQTGRVLSVEYRGRGPTLALGDLKMIFTDFRDAGGIVLPWKSVVEFDGKPVASMERIFNAQAVNEPLNTDLFTR